VRLHAGIGYVTPDDEHTGRAHAIRTARTQGLQQAREHRITYVDSSTKKGLSSERCV
jgi:hypothetical protein